MEDTNSRTNHGVADDNLTELLNLLLPETEPAGTQSIKPETTAWLSQLEAATPEPSTFACDSLEHKLAEAVNNFEVLKTTYEAVLDLVRQRPDGHPESHLRAVEGVVIHFAWDIVKETCIGYDTDKVLQAQYEIYGELNRLWGEPGHSAYGIEFHDHCRRTYALVENARSLL